MSEVQNEWGSLLTRKGSTPALWLTYLLKGLDLDLVMRGGCSVCARKLVAEGLLLNSRYGKVDADQALNDDDLMSWESAENSALHNQSDGLKHFPSQALPLLVRELAQSIELGGIDPVGVRSDSNPLLTGWQARLTRQACEVYQWEREQNAADPRDWVPRVAYKEGRQWADAAGVELPIFFVTSDAAGNSVGVNGRLRLWLWPCQGARLAWLPTVPQRVQPLARSWHKGLEQAQTWITQKMKGQGGTWQDHALVWDVYTPDHGHSVLSGASASAAFALAGLWLVRHCAPEQWKAQLISMAQKDWLHTHITAVICPGNLSGNGQQDLMPVEGVKEKSFASWVLKQGNRNGNVPLHVASGQIVEAAALGQPEPKIHPHVSAFALMHRLARQALNLSEKQVELHASLHEYLYSFAPIKRNVDPDAPWHLPDHEPPQIENNEAGAEAHWQQVVEAVAFEASPPDHLVPFALTRWAKRASEMHEGGQVHRLFVNLHVSEQHRPQKRGQATRAAAAGGAQPEYDSLAQLLAAYEDHEHPAQQVQALQIVGAPGSGKTWLLARFEQACMERLLWQHDHQASQPQPIDVAQIEADPYPYFSVPLYVPLSTLPVEHQTAKEILEWFCGQVLGCTNPLDSRLHNRLLRPDSERDIRLRVILDGLNELKVAPDQTRQARAKQVVRAIWQGLKPGLPMLLGTRTHHEFALDDNSDAASPFQVAVANLLPWRLKQIESYLRQRWAHYPELLERTDSIVTKLDRDDGKRLRDVLSLPLYLRIQCELMEAGATELLDSRARLLAALLWLNLYKEFIVKEGDGRGDSGLVTAQERAIATEFARKPDGDPPAFPRKGRLLQGLFAMAYQLWLARSDEPVASRGQVAVALEDVAVSSAQSPQAVSVRGCLRGLGWSDRDEAQREAWIDQWIQAAKELGWLTEDAKSQTARFAHQAYGELLASQQLLWQPRHASLHRHPQPTDWSLEELAKLARQLAPPALERGCLDELEQQGIDADLLWEQAQLGPLFDAWLKDGIQVDWQAVEAEMPAQFLRNQEGSPRRIWLSHNILEEGKGTATWRFAQMGDLFAELGSFLKLDAAQTWHQQVSAWRYLLTYSDTWSVFRNKAQQQVAQHLGSDGSDRAERLWQATGLLPEAPPGALDEIMLLALEALPDPLPWLQGLFDAARHATPKGNALGATRLTGCWALLSHCLAQEAYRLDQRHGDTGALAHLRRGVVELLLGVNQSPDPELNTPQRSDATAAAHDLRHRLQAGLLLGKQGPLGSDAGDHVRYERLPGQTNLVRLRREHWCRVDPDDGNVQAFLMARFSVTVGEYQVFVDAGGYCDEDAPWWLQDLPPERSAARAWLLREQGQTEAKEHRPYILNQERYNNPLQPMVALTWYEACAYACWADAQLYAPWRAEVAEALGLVPAQLRLRLPTEREWSAAQGGHTHWPGHDGAGDPSPLLFNRQATGWGRTAPVATFPRSQTRSGLMDVSGNQWEWCANAFIEDESDASAYVCCPADLGNDQKHRALRGGSYFSTATLCRVGYRYHRTPGYFNNSLGFRLMLGVAL